MKTLLLVSSGVSRPERSELLRQQEADLIPRVLSLPDALHADVLDGRYLASVRSPVARLSRRAPVFAQQILEAFRSRSRYDAMVSWSEQLGLPLAGLLRFVPKRPAHLGIFSWISKPKKAVVLRAVQKGFDRLILMSTAQRDFAVERLGLPERMITLLHWPVDEKFWRSVAPAEDMISSVGREMRDYETLVAALDGTGIRCHIAAGGQVATQEGDVSVRAVSSRADLPAGITVGWRDFAGLRDMYSRSRFVVIPLLPTDTDNGTTSIIEAMAVGKAVICTKVDGQRDVIRDRENGLFVPPQDPRALREAIQYLWENPGIAEEMGRRGQEFMHRTHRLDTWVEAVREAVEESVAERRRGR
jgi:glycosyltransferase involved in cell wall biosynthesis